jgi:hypothetical protein
MGTKDAPGVLPRAVARLFRQLHSRDNPHKHFQVRLTYVELYRNKFYDLLDGGETSNATTTSGVSSGWNSSSTTSGGLGRSYGGVRMSMGRQSSSFSGSSANDDRRGGAISEVELRESKSRGIFLTGGPSIETPVESVDGTLSRVRQGNLRRATAFTDANSRSSRSHAIVTLHVDFYRDAMHDRKLLRTTKLHVLDLAGSERVSVRYGFF